MTGPHDRDAQDGDPQGGRRFRPWQITAGVLGLLVLAGILFAVTRDDGSEDATSDDSSTSESTASTVAPDPVTDDVSDPLPTTPEGQPALACTVSTLVAGTPSVALSTGAVATKSACTPVADGEGYAWVRFEAPGADPLDVFFRAEVGAAGVDPGVGGVVAGEWVVVSYGSDVFCDDEIPVDVCSTFLPEAPVR